MQDHLVEVGRIVNTHGIKGELKVMANSSDPNRFTAFKEVFVADEGLIRSQKDPKGSKTGRLLGEPEMVLDFSKLRKVEVLSARAHKGAVLVTLKGVEDLDSARQLVGKCMAVRQQDLPKLEDGLYYIFELVGLVCDSTVGKRLGVVTDLIDLPANDVLVISEDGPERKEFMVPMVKAIVKQIDLDGRRIVIEDLKGLR